MLHYHRKKDVNPFFFFLSYCENNYRTRGKVFKEEEKSDLKNNVFRTPFLEQISVLRWCHVLQKNPHHITLLLITG